MYSHLQRYFRATLAMALGLLSVVFLTVPSIAQEATRNDREPGSRRVIEEIYVTAQKREEGIRDVPISLVAVDTEFLAEKGITDLSELSNYVPNVKLRTDNGVGIDLNIRGFSKQSGNPAFDQAVGLLVDGVSYNDNDFFVTGLVDLARIEVLRGPQGTLLGKNTTAGLLNVTTKSPSDEFGGFIDAQRGQYDQQRYEAALGGPLIPGFLNFRVAGLRDTRDGVVRNTTADIEQDPRSFFDGTPARLLNRDRTVLRFKLEFPDLFGSTLGLQYERAKVSAIGNGTEILAIDQGSADYLRQFDPQLDIRPGNYRTSKNDPGFSKREVEKYVLSWSRSFGEWDVQATAGHATVSGLVNASDPTPAPLFGSILLTDKPQYNVDMLISSPDLFGGAMDFTAGFFYEDKELELDNDLLLNTEPTLGLILANDPDAPLVLPPSLLPPFLGLDPLLQESTTQLFTQETETAAVYGQINWHITDRWTLTPGVRVSREKKSADISRVFNSVNTLLLTSTLGYEEFEASLKRSETTVQPKISLSFKPNEDISLFVHWARGFRAGGFNAAAGRAEGLDYDKEVVDEYAFNAKTLLLNGILQFNFGVYRMELSDFQLLTSGPDDLSVVTVNAGRARSQGVEADLLWLATDWLSISTAVGYNDATFTRFPFGPCAPDRPNTDGDGDPRCDLTGEALPYSPEWSGALTAGVRMPLTRIAGVRHLPVGALEFIASASAEYQTTSTTGLPGDSRFTQGEYVRFDASLGLANPRQGWAFRVTGKNLSNETVNRFVGTVPTTNNLVQALEAPRTVYAQLRWSFE